MMKQNDLLTQWLTEEQAAHIHGWDFSHIRGRYQEEDNLPWDYGRLVRQYLRPESRILDIDTGGGEFLLSLGHPPQNTSPYSTTKSPRRPSLFPSIKFQYLISKPAQMCYNTFIYENWGSGPRKQAGRK